jgi:hypothetical protein
MPAPDFLLSRRETPAFPPKRIVPEGTFLLTAK